MPRIVTIEQHAVFVTLADGSKYRVSEWHDWSDAIAMWTAMDGQRREAVAAKGMLAINRFPGNFEQIKHYEVRSENDPAYTSLAEMSLPRHFRVLSREYTTDTAAAKAVLKPLGYFSRTGGWVYYWDERHPGLERVLAQGWWQAARMTGHVVVRLDGEKGYRAVVTTSLLVKSEAPS